MTLQWRRCQAVALAILGVSAACAADASRVMGDIEVAAGEHRGDISTVNVSIELAPQAKVNGKVHTVNGKLTLADGADVSGALVNVNGAIKVAAS